MIKEIKKQIILGGDTLTISTGKYANMTNSSVMVSIGDTSVLCTVASSNNSNEDMNFLPLTVNYREMAYAAGKIPGGFFKREGKGSERETLISRLIDRPIRPMFRKGFSGDTQVICTVHSYDEKHNPDIIAMIGASAALALSEIPMQNIISGVRVGKVGDELKLNPSLDELKESELDLVVAGTDESIVMVESAIKELDINKMQEALEFAHNNIKPVVELIKELQKEAGNKKWEIEESKESNTLKNIKKNYEQNINEALKIKSKKERVALLSDIKSKIIEDNKEVEDFNMQEVGTSIDSIKSDILRDAILQGKKRIDGRSHTEIRDINCEVGIFSRTHGSALFTRGETQALVVTTLGSTVDEQIVDDLTGDEREHFMLHYVFPPYSVGEVSMLRGPGRREIGHGKLSLRALESVMPSKEDFPYTQRVVSEIIACNGSSSMATVCGASLSLMNAGVPIKSHVAGIAMGLIKEDKKHVVLSDIMSDEDQLGDMDLKVTGTRNGLTALQMDIKIPGITADIIKESLESARNGLDHILGKMEECLKTPQKSLSEYAPQIKVIKINTDKIKDLIGPGGKIIQEISESTNSKIDVDKDGLVKIATSGGEKNMQLAMEKISGVVSSPELGKIYEGKVVKIIESGAFVNYFGSKDGFVHISEVSNERVENIDDYLKEGDVVKVKLIEIDFKGKAKLTLLLDKEVRQSTRKPYEGRSRREGGSRREGVSQQSFDGKRSGRFNKKPNNKNGNTLYDKPKKQSGFEAIKKYFS